MAKYEYPLDICEHCSYTNYGNKPYHDGYPNSPCEGAWCEDAAEEYEIQTGKKWDGDE